MQLTVVLVPMFMALSQFKFKLFSCIAAVLISPIKEIDLSLLGTTKNVESSSCSRKRQFGLIS